jgi:hypothetical protein
LYKLILNVLLKLLVDKINLKNMNKRANFIPSVGHLSAEEIISATWLKFSDFDWKSVLDIGCGLWDSLRVLDNETEATHLVWIDPIFKTPESLRVWIDNTREYIHELMTLFKWDNETIEKLRDREAALNWFQKDDKGIMYHPSIVCTWAQKFDYVFISYVFGHLTDIMQHRLIDEAYSKQKKEVLYQLLIIEML